MMVAARATTDFTSSEPDLSFARMTAWWTSTHLSSTLSWSSSPTPTTAAFDAMTGAGTSTGVATTPFFPDAHNSSARSGTAANEPTTNEINPSNARGTAISASSEEANTRAASGTFAHDAADAHTNLPFGTSTDFLRAALATSLNPDFSGDPSLIKGFGSKTAFSAPLSSEELSRSGYFSQTNDISTKPPSQTDNPEDGFNPSNNIHVVVVGSVVGAVVASVLMVLFVLYMLKRRLLRRRLLEQRSVAYLFTIALTQAHSQRGNEKSCASMGIDITSTLFARQDVRMPFQEQMSTVEMEIAERESQNENEGSTLINSSSDNDRQEMHDVRPQEDWSTLAGLPQQQSRRNMEMSDEPPPFYEAREATSATI
jgi:hypothetical protein